MDREIKVSVIMPVYQVENYLERAAESVLAQTLEEKELILVDDGSTDASPQICDRLAANHPGLVRVIHQENQGLGMARNAGVRAALGRYVAFVDSDDTVEPEMYESMFRLAEAEGDDVVMCDVRILYVDEGRESVSVTYPHERIDLADYLANGNNITYSVNKLFRRELWEHTQYEKMLFEDIALIPALMTRCTAIGYVRQPFYNYYRREGTLSTSFVGDMVDIIRAFRSFLDNSNPVYREEAVYNTAKQLLWNMTQSRVLFQADFIELIQAYKQDFLLNHYIAEDKKVRRILEFVDRPVIPETFICPHLGRPLPEDYRERLRTDFPQATLLEADEHALPEDVPPSVREALEQGNTRYAEEYMALRLLSEHGGIVLMPERRACLPLKRLRLDSVFFGFENDEELTAGCFGALPGHYVIRALLDTYDRDCIFNRALLPLADRLRDFLMLHFQLKPNGRKQLLKKEIPVYLPSVLAYDMQDGENCCRRGDMPLPEGYEAVSSRVLKMWSDRILENWNLYKQERARKPSGGKTPPPPPPSPTGPSAAAFQRELERQIQEVVDTYERSTSWRLTKPIRALGKLLHKGRK